MCPRCSCKRTSRSSRGWSPWRIAMAERGECPSEAALRNSTPDGCRVGSEWRKTTTSSPATSWSASWCETPASSSRSLTKTATWSSHAARTENELTGQHPKNRNRLFGQSQFKASCRPWKSSYFGQEGEEKSCGVHENQSHRLSRLIRLRFLSSLGGGPQRSLKTRERGTRLRPTPKPSPGSNSYL